MAFGRQAPADEFRQAAERLEALDQAVTFGQWTVNRSLAGDVLSLTIELNGIRVASASFADGDVADIFDVKTDIERITTRHPLTGLLAEMLRVWERSARLTDDARCAFRSTDPELKIARAINRAATP